MEEAVRRYRRGKHTLKECEYMIDLAISSEVRFIEDIDKRIDTERKLKRKAWRLLLEATR